MAKKPTKTQLYNQFVEEFENSISQGMEPGTAFEHALHDNEGVNVNKAAKFYEKWTAEFVTEETDEDTPIGVQVSQEEIKAIYDGLEESGLEETPFDIGTAVALLVDGAQVTNDDWNTSDGFPRLEMQITKENTIELTRIDCVGGVARPYTLTTNDLISRSYRFVA